jgi:hypothetical protein
MDEEKQPETTEPTAKKDFYDFNASWILMFVYIGFLASMIFWQRNIFNAMYNSEDYNYFVFIFISFLLGIVATFLIYNLGKLLAAKIAGYDIVYTKLAGFTIDHSKAKVKVSFHILEIGDVEMKFAPKSDDIKRNPTPIFFGGFLFELIVIAIGLAMFFVFAFNKGANANSFLGYMFLFGTLYGLVIPLYESLPFRQDSPNDMFNFLNTKKPEEKEAYNLLNINRKRELNGQDFLVPAQSILDTYYPIHVLYYVYLDHLYKNELEAAVSVLDTMKLNKKKFDDTERYLPASESLYLRYLIDDETGADNLYLTLKGEEKSAITNPSDLADFRTSLLVLGYISSDKEAIQDLLKKYHAKLAGLEPSDRVKKEQALFDQAYKTLRSKKPDLGLAETY